MAVPPFRVKAVYEYSSGHDDDLKFPNGQIITITDVEDADWYFGEYLDTTGNKQEGLFPKNFVESYEPATPPRPSRVPRAKRDAELEPEAEPALPIKESQYLDEPGSRQLPQEQNSSTQPATSRVNDVQSRKVAGPPTDGSAAEPPSRAPESGDIAPPGRSATDPSAIKSPKPTPAPVTEKPASGSFRDRIAAFNKSTAPPVAPMKPGALSSTSGSGFVKKPFVAPPPSKNAYVPPPRDLPPQKVYRREEDPEIAADTSSRAEPDARSAASPPVHTGADDDDQPKPTSLKERIALLQQQQMEQAARHADAGHKKEKPKRPPTKRTESNDGGDEADIGAEEADLERMDSAETTGRRSIETTRDDVQPLARSLTRTKKPAEVASMISPGMPSREMFSDANDADQSGAGDTEEGEEVSTGRDDSDEKPRTKAPLPPQRAPQLPNRETEAEAKMDKGEEDEEDEDEDIDPEVKRRMDIRERMAKMSGGMGMPGMFGPSSGMQSMATRKPKPATSNERKSSEDQASKGPEPTVPRAPPVPIMPLPGMTSVRSPEPEIEDLEVSKEDEPEPRSITQGRRPDEMPDVEDLTEEPVLMSRKSVERGTPLHIPQDRPVPHPPVTGRIPPPPTPADQAVPPVPPVESRPVPPAPSAMMGSPSAGYESDDEMPSRPGHLSLNVPDSDSSRPISRDAPPPIPSNGPPPSLPHRPQVPGSPTASRQQSPHLGSDIPSPTFPTTPGGFTNRTSRVPPIPGSIPPSGPPSQTRAPPPPPPGVVPSSRKSTGNSNILTSPSRHQAEPESDEEVTEYEGDYDTDIASGETHKDALRSHARDSSLEDAGVILGAPPSIRSSLPPSGPPPTPIVNAPRAVPPPPPNQPPRTSRASTDMPRAAPPPPPPPKESSLDEGEDYDPYRYTSYRLSGPVDTSGEGLAAPTSPNVQDEHDDLYSASPPRRYVPAPPPEAASQFPPPSEPPPSNRGMPRQSLDVQRSNTIARRSMEAPRPSGEQHGHIASDVDLGEGSGWWVQHGAPPPIFQNRRDLIFEIEQSSSSKRGGKTTISKDVYVLFLDYSQTVVTARFDSKDPADVSLEQRHEPPPARPRQDQLENAHESFGLRIAEGANTKQNGTVGDGTPHALVLDLLKTLPDALLPVGVRAFGALVYVNMANASVQQYDEIRAGDIVTFRNARFQGHRGPMHQKYNMEVGKSDHVAVVVDWDGTKKKVRAWEQGRESRKVKMESFKLGDLRSGEVKVWRVMARAWVGWEGQN